jgi:hypothetical protein
MITTVLRERMRQAHPHSQHVASYRTGVLLCVGNRNFNQGHVRRRPSVGGGDDRTPTETRATPVGAGACRRRAPPAPPLPCALLDRGEPSMGTTGTRRFTIGWSDGPF